MPLLFAMFVDLLVDLFVEVIQACITRLSGTKFVPFFDFVGCTGGDVMEHVFNSALGNELFGSLVHNFPECLLPFDGICGVGEFGKLSLSVFFESRPVSFGKVNVNFVCRFFRDGDVGFNFDDDWQVV